MQCKNNKSRLILNSGSLEQRFVNQALLWVLTRSSGTPNALML